MFKNKTFFIRWILLAVLFFIIFSVMDWLFDSKLAGKEMLKSASIAVVTGFFMAFLDREQAPWKKDKNNPEAQG